MSGKERTDWRPLLDLEDECFQKMRAQDPDWPVLSEELDRRRQEFISPLLTVFMKDVFARWKKRAESLCGDPKYVRVIELMEYAFRDGARAALHWDRSAEEAAEIEGNGWYQGKKAEWDAVIQEKRDRQEFFEAFEKAWKKEQKRRAKEAKA